MPGHLNKMLSGERETKHDKVQGYLAHEKQRSSGPLNRMLSGEGETKHDKVTLWLMPLEWLATIPAHLNKMMSGEGKTKHDKVFLSC